MTKYFIIINILFFSISSCNNKKVENSDEDSLLMEAKFWVYAFNSNSDILCFRNKNRQTIEKVNFYLTEKKNTDSTIEYRFNCYLNDTFYYCNIFPMEVNGIVFLKRNNSLKCPIHKDIEFADKYNYSKSKVEFEKAEKRFKQIINERPEDIKKNQELMKLLVKKGYLK